MRVCMRVRRDVNILKPPRDKFGVPETGRLSPAPPRYNALPHLFLLCPVVKMRQNQSARGDHPTALQGCQPHRQNRELWERLEVSLCEV